MTDDQQLTRNLQALHTDEDPNPAFAEALFAKLEDEVAAPPRASRTWMLLAAAALIAVVATGAAFGSGLVRVPWLIADATLVPTPSVEPVPSESSLPSPTSEPTPLPTATAVPEPSTDWVAQVAVPGLTLRDAAGLDGEALGTFSEGQVGLVIQGPVMADGYEWYQFSALGLPPNSGCAVPVDLECPTWFGWVAAASQDGEPWIEPTSLDCPDSPMNMQDLALARGDVERLACNPDGSITVRGWWPEQPDEPGLGGACASGPPSGWLYCQNINYNLVVMDDTRSSEGFGLKVSIDPASGVTMPERGQWIEVVGHFDDPAAPGCAENAVQNGDLDVERDQVVLTCRTQLVAESVEPVSGPF